MECLSICIYSRCIKKSSEFSRGRSPYTIIYTHTLAYRDLLSGNKKRFCLATDTIKVLCSCGWTSARSPGHLQNAAHPQLIGRWGWMDGHVFSDCGRGGGREVVESWGILYSLTRGWAEGPRQQQLPPFWRHKTKRAPLVPPASGPPSLPQGRVHQPSERTPSILPSLPLPACPVLFVQPGRITGSKPPWTNCFHLRPTFFDDALTNMVGIKPSANNEVKWYKKSPEKQGQPAALIICWERWGHCSAWMPAPHWHTRVCAGMLGCRMYYGNTVQLLHMRLCLSYFLEKLHQLNWPPCPDTFLSQGTLGEESVISA